MEPIVLEDYLLNANAESTIYELKPLLDNLKINLVERFSKNSDSITAYDLVEKTIKRYGGVYKSLESPLKKVNIERLAPDEFLRLYMTYVSSEASKQLLSNGDTMLKKMVYSSKVPLDFKLTLETTNHRTLVDAVEHLANTAIRSSSPYKVKDYLKNYFDLLSMYSVNKMESPLFSKYKSLFEELSVEGRNFKVEGIKKIEFRKPQNDNGKDPTGDEYTKGLEEFVLEPVGKDEIVGNEDGISLLERQIQCLMTYDVKEKRNPFKNQFKQFLLFAGKKGTGKTMLARYGMTFAREIAVNYKIPLSLVKLEFEDRYQDGPILNLQHQFKQISSGNNPYIVFIDEIDKKIPSDDDRKGYRDAILREFLKFRGGGDYINKGNYVLTGTSNEPNRIHPPILDVFEVEEIRGPRTPEQRLQVLYNNLKLGIQQGYVRLSQSDWREIADLLKDCDLSGRDLFNIASSSVQKYLDIAKRLPKNLSATETEKLIKKIMHDDGVEFTTNKKEVFKALKDFENVQRTKELSFV